ncbi:MAG: Ig-like domain-containing protein [Candidatus Bipolaricaulia bacterium]
MGLLVLGLLLGPSSALAQTPDSVSVTVPDTSAAPGDTVAVPIQVGNLDQADAVTAYKIDFGIADTTVASYAGFETANTLSGAAGFSVSDNPAIPRIAAFGSSSINAEANAGTLVRVLLVVEAQDSTTVTLTDVEFNAGSPPATPTEPSFLISGVTVQPPTAKNDTFSTQEGDTLNVAASNGVLTNDSDPTGGGLTASLVQDVSNGTLTLNQNGSFEYIPNQGFSGTDSFVYEAANPDSTDQATVTINVADVNGPPTVAQPLPDDTLHVPGPALQITGLERSAFTDPDGDSLSLSSSSGNAAVATASVASGTVTVQPQSTGQAQITITATDPFSATATATFTAVVEDRPQGEDTPVELAKAIVAPSDTGRAALGQTGVGALFQDVQSGGAVRVSFVPDSNATGTPSFNQSYQNVSGYRWDIENQGMNFASVDVAFSLDDADITGVGAASKVTILAASGPDGTFEAVTTQYDSANNLLVAKGLTGFSTIKMASDDSDNPLPVEMAAFTATAVESGALLEWRTASETGNAGFEVQHQGPDAASYANLGFVEGAGTATTSQSYQFRVEDLTPGTHQFRLRQVDTEGASSYTEPVTVTIEAKRALTLQTTGPNPVRQGTQIAFTVKRSGPADVALYNVLGQQVRQLHRQKATVGERYTVKVRTDGLPTGKYFVQLAAPTGTRTQQIVVVN